MNSESRTRSAVAPGYSVPAADEADDALASRENRAHAQEATHFGYRALQVRDLPRCVDVLGDRFLYADNELDSLVQMWRQVLQSECGHGGFVFEEGSPDRPVAFGIDALIDDSLARVIRERPQPQFGRRIFDEWRAGRNPFSTESEAARANAGDGVDVLTLHCNWMASPQDEGYVVAALSESFFLQHLGWNLRSFTSEIYTHDPMLADQAGMKSVIFGVEGAAESSPPSFLVWATRTEAVAQPGNILLGRLFLRYSPPLLELRRDDRLLLRLALEIPTDEGVASALDLSLSAVKKRWRSIFDTIEDTYPSILPERAVPGQRGTELRRHVLGYVRDHPEELRPHVPFP
jgi:hypothetical protein